jgi:hypothetical protein
MITGMMVIEDHSDYSNSGDLCETSDVFSVDVNAKKM